MNARSESRSAGHPSGARQHLDSFLGGGRVAPDARRDPRLIALLLPPALYAALAMTSQINIGIRHILPLYPFLTIAAAVAVIVPASTSL